jgi:hypothetical protein
MGGNAMKHIGVVTERKPAGTYWAIMQVVTGTLANLFPYARNELIKSYANKPTFGDGDVLLENNLLPSNWVELIEGAFGLKPNEIIRNGGVISFAVFGMQVDIISTPKEEFDIASVYFAFNDLGNLMGRVAHSFGFKYGHDGLYYSMREGTNKFAEVLVTDDPAEIFSFLGYDYSVFLNGFEELDDIFAFASSSPFFHRDIFHLENRNNAARTRDAKRPTYTAFLEWMKDKPELDKCKELAFINGEKHPDRDRWKEVLLLRAFIRFPSFAKEYNKAMERHNVAKEAKLLWNGEIVSGLTGLQGKDLGAFISFCKTPMAFEILPFDEWIISQTKEDIEQFIKTSFESFKSTKEQDD